MVGDAARIGLAGIRIANGAVGLVALWGLRRLEAKHEGDLRRKVSLVFDENGPAAGEVVRVLGAAGIRASPVEYERSRDERRVHVALHVGMAAADEARLVQILDSLAGLRSLRVEAIA